MKDQYGDTIPTLVPLPIYCCNENNCEYLACYIYNAAWYEYNNVLYVSAEIADVLDLDYDATEILYADENTQLLFIHTVLKRWTFEDGFYHA